MKKIIFKGSFILLFVFICWSVISTSMEVYTTILNDSISIAIRFICVPVELISIILFIYYVRAMVEIIKQH